MQNEINIEELTIKQAREIAAMFGDARDAMPQPTLI